MSLRYGSLFAGYGGLEMGVQSVLGGTTAWHCEIEPAPSKILAHHWPATPNLGDITAVKWTPDCPCCGELLALYWNDAMPDGRGYYCPQDGWFDLSIRTPDVAEPIEILTGGFPCQDVSHAGKRLGLKPGTRSGLWSHMAYAIDQLRPRLVVAENVRGLLSAEAGGDLEPCPWCVGDGEGSPLRALGAVLGDLADLGYDAQWVGVRAADAGAPHGRFRVFVYAWPTDTDGVGHERPGSARGRRGGPSDGGVAPADADVTGREGTQPAGGRHLPARRALADTDRNGLQGVGRLKPVGRDADGRSRSDVAWGVYEPAIRRWERLTRPAPAPTEPGKNGQPRLSPAFVEWMQGLPAGHVTDPAIGLTRNEQLKALGNGVVPQQAALATRLWLATSEAVAA